MFQSDPGFYTGATNFMLAIRKAATADIELIRVLVMQVWPQTYTPIVGERQVAYMLEQFYSPESLRKQMEEQHQFLICHDGDTPVGFASYAEIEPGIYKLHKLYILTSLQGSGIGRFVLDFILKEIAAKGAIALHLNVNRYNRPAIAFYERLGFQQIRIEDIDIGSGYFMNDYVMGLALS